jgi:putative oxidoreductase
MLKRPALLIQLLFAVMLLAFGVMGAFGFEPPEAPERAGAYRDALLEAGFVFPAVYVTYFLVGAMWTANVWAPFGTVLLAPVTVSIVLFHAFLYPGNFPVAPFVVVPQVVMVWAHRGSYKGVFRVGGAGRFGRGA